MHAELVSDIMPPPLPPLSATAMHPFRLAEVLFRRFLSPFTKTPEPQSLGLCLDALISNNTETEREPTQV
jgi:hypothetical protein